MCSAILASFNGRKFYCKAYKESLPLIIRNEENFNFKFKAKKNFNSRGNFKLFRGILSMNFRYIEVIFFSILIFIDLIMDFNVFPSYSEAYLENLSRY